MPGQIRGGPFFSHKFSRSQTFTSHSPSLQKVRGLARGGSPCELSGKSMSCVREPGGLKGLRETFKPLRQKGLDPRTSRGKVVGGRQIVRAEKRGSREFGRILLSSSAARWRWQLPKRIGRWMCASGLPSSRRVQARLGQLFIGVSHNHLSVRPFIDFHSCANF